MPARLTPGDPKGDGVQLPVGLIKAPAPAVAPLHQPKAGVILPFGLIIPPPPADAGTIPLLQLAPAAAGNYSANRTVQEEYSARGDVGCFGVYQGNWAATAEVLCSSGTWTLTSHVGPRRTS